MTSNAVVRVHQALSQALTDAFEIPPADADRFCLGFLRQIGEQLGGARLYLPRGDKTARDAAIRAEFDGVNVRALATRYNLSRAQVYRIVTEKSHEEKTD